MKQSKFTMLTDNVRSGLGAMMDWPGSLDVLVFVTSFGLYLKTLCPTVYTFDSAELTTGAYTLGIVHNTGYPLYLMLAKAFTLIIPFGDIAYRVNLFSALCASLSLVITRRIALIIWDSTHAAILATGMLAVSYPLWSVSVVAEVYTLHILFLSAILWLALYWRQGAGGNYLIALGLTLGLSFGNHMSTILFVPGIAYWIWDTFKQKRETAGGFSTLMLAGLALSIGFLTYLYLPIRYLADPPFNFARAIGLDLSTFQGVLAFMRGATLEHVFFGYPLVEVPEQILSFFGLVWETYLGIGLLLAVIGLVESWKQDRSTTIFLSLIFIFVAVFFINYAVFDKNTMFLPVFLILSLWISGGIQGILERISADKLKLTVRWSSVGLIVLMLILNYPRVDLSDNRITRQFAEEVFQEAPSNSLLVGHWVDTTPLEYLRMVEGQRPDVIIFDYSVYGLRRLWELEAKGYTQATAWYIIKNEIYQAVEDHLASGQAAYSIGENPILESAFDQEQISNWLYVIAPRND